jgi:hypothetical protein
MDQYYVDIDGHTAGPFSIEDLRAMRAAGAIQDETLFCKPGAQEWLPLKVISGLLVVPTVAVPPVPVFENKVASRKPIARRRDLVCLQCGHVGAAERRVKGSFLVEIALYLLFCAPGIIYTLWRHTTVENVCRSCKGTNIIPASSPNARGLVELV